MKVNLKKYEVDKKSVAKKAFIRVYVWQPIDSSFLSFFRDRTKRFGHVALEIFDASGKSLHYISLWNRDDKIERKLGADGMNHENVVQYFDKALFVKKDAEEKLLLLPTAYKKNTVELRGLDVEKILKFLKESFHLGTRDVKKLAWSVYGSSEFFSGDTLNCTQIIYNILKSGEINKYPLVVIASQDTRTLSFFTIPFALYLSHSFASRRISGHRFNQLEGIQLLLGAVAIIGALYTTAGLRPKVFYEDYLKPIKELESGQPSKKTAARVQKVAEMQQSSNPLIWLINRLSDFIAGYTIKKVPIKNVTPKK